jgi:hypothetical protein
LLPFSSSKCKRKKARERIAGGLFLILVSWLYCWPEPSADTLVT